MTTNQTIDGVSRELLADLADYAESGKVPEPWMADKLRALLDAPAVHPELGSTPADHMAWLLDKVVHPGDYPAHVLHDQIRATLEVISKPASQTQGEPVAMNREQFEAWVLGRAHPVYGWLDKNWLLRGDNPQNYADPYVQGLWVASQSLCPEQPAPVAKKYDDTLLPFLALMRKELHANAGKGDRPGWLAMSRDQGMLEIYYHASKLQKAVRDGNGAGTREYAADVANMCMMLLDICGGLVDEK